MCYTYHRNTNDKLKDKNPFHNFKRILCRSIGTYFLCTCMTDTRKINNFDSIHYNIIQFLKWLAFNTKNIPYINQLQFHVTVLPAKHVKVSLEITGGRRSSSATWNSLVSGRWDRYLNLFLNSCIHKGIAIEHTRKEGSVAFQFLLLYMYIHYRVLPLTYLCHKHTLHFYYFSSDGLRAMF